MINWQLLQAYIKRASSVLVKVVMPACCIPVDSRLPPFWVTLSGLDRKSNNPNFSPADDRYTCYRLPKLYTQIIQTVLCFWIIVFQQPFAIYLLINTLKGTCHGVLSDIFTNTWCVKNLKVAFFTKGPYIRKVESEWRGKAPRLWWQSWNWKC